MAKVLIEFEANSKQLASVIALLNGGKAAKKEEEPADEEPADEEPEEDEDLAGGEDDEVQPTLELLKETAQKLIAAGKSGKLKEVLKTFKAAKVVEVNKKDYAKFLAAIKKIK